MMDEREELSAAERAAFAGLRREAMPAADLEERTVAMLRRAGHLPTPLAALSQLPDSGNAAARDSVRIVALRVLGQAAQEMALIAPDDPLAAAVLRGLNQRSRENSPTAPSRSVVWY